jgi:hypothetical protein
MIVRKEMKKLIRQSENRSISIVIGARQVGKSTLLDMVRESLTEPSDLFNLENPLHLSIFNEGYISFLRNIRAKTICIDEFQYCKGISSVFKAVYDLNPELKIYATGSSSLDIQTHLKESLAGRKMETILYPLSYGEWLGGTAPAYPGFATLREDFDLGLATPEDEVAFHAASLRRYFRYGALPGLAALSQDDDIEKREYLFGIYQTYIAKDIKAFLKEESVLSFNKALSWLALRNGSQLNKSSLSVAAGISTRQIDRYLDVLSGTFVMALLPPYSDNRGKELTKTPKYYFYDQGVVNSIIQDFRPLELRMDTGSIREQFVFWELKKHMDIRFSLYYWRTPEGREVDFILVKDRELMPIEVKSSWNPPSIPSGLAAFLSRYPETKAAVILYDGSERRGKFGNTDVFFAPLHRAWELYGFFTAVNG